MRPGWRTPEPSSRSGYARSVPSSKRWSAAWPRRDLAARLRPPGIITLTDGRTGQPLDGLPIAAVDAEGKPCAEPIATTTGGGHTAIPGPCARRGWTLRVGDAGWWVPEPPAAEGAAVTAWRVPPTGGLGLLRGTELTPLLTNTAVDLAALTPDDRIPYPVEIPPRSPPSPGTRCWSSTPKGSPSRP